MDQKAPVGGRKNIHSLTGLRGVSALAVVVHHCWLAAEINYGAPGGVPGQWAVDLFFVLSGFVLALTYLGRPINWRRFAVARFARIYPLHIATACVMALVLVIEWKSGATAKDPSLTVGQAIRELGMLTAMPLVGRNMFWNGPSWSISVEAWTYVLLFPVIVLTDRTIRARWLALAIFGLLVLLAITMYHLPAGVRPHRGWVALARAMIGFAGGWAAHSIWRSEWNPMTARRTDLLAVTVVAALCSVPITRIEPWFLMPIFPALVLGLASGPSVSSAALSRPSVRYLGDISFSIYLTHIMVLMCMLPLLERFGFAHSFTALTLAVLPITITISAFTYSFLEKPSRDQIRLWLDPKDGPESRDTAASF